MFAGLCFDASDAIALEPLGDDEVGGVKSGDRSGSRGGSGPDGVTFERRQLREEKIREFADAVAALLAMTPAGRDTRDEGKDERAARIARSTFWRVRDVLSAAMKKSETKFDGAPDRAGVRRDYTPRDYVFPENDRDLMHLLTRYEHPVYNLTKQSVKESGLRDLLKECGPREPPGWVMPRDPNPSVWVTGEKLPESFGAAG